MTHDAIRLPAAPPARLSPPPAPEAPYRGIEAFRYIDQQIFSARSEETWELLSSVIIYRGVLLYGDSGSGKSSLVNAGLLPAALRENFSADRLRVQPRRGRELKVERIPEKFPDRPPYLPSAFVEPGSAEDSALSVELSVEEFCARLGQFRLTGPPAPPGEGPPAAPRRLLIFDQFEEFITLFEEAARGGETEEAKLAQSEAPEAQQALLGALARLLEDETLPVKLLFVFREDYLAKLSPLLEPRAELLNQSVRLLPPRAAQAAEIIRAPFADQALRESFFAGEGARRAGGEITPELAAEIAAQLRERSEGGFVNLSELQIVCQKLWESADAAAFYEGTGRNVQAVIEGYWADAFEKLPAELKEPAIALLGHLVTSAGTRNIISEYDLKAQERAGFEPAMLEAALDTLVERRLVRREPRHEIYFYEITSEFLVPWIQQKKGERLARLKAERLAAETAARLNYEIGRKRLFRTVAAACALLLLMFVVVIILMFRSMRQTEEAQLGLMSAQQTLEEKNSAIAQERGLYSGIIQDLIDLSSQDSARRLSAVESLKKKQAEGKLMPDVVPVVLEAIARDRNSQVVNAGADLASQAAVVANPELTKSIIKATEGNSALASKLPPRAYIKLASEGQGPRAHRIAAALKRMGFAIPPIAIVPGTRRANQLRYHEPTGGTDPNTVLRAVSDAGGGSWKLAALGESKTARPGHFEVWFAGEAPAPTPTPTPVRPRAPSPDETLATAALISQITAAREELITNLQSSDPRVRDAARARLRRALSDLGHSPQAQVPDQAMLDMLLMLSVRATTDEEYKAILRALGVR